MSRNAVSLEHFAIFAHFDEFRTPNHNAVITQLIHRKSKKILTKLSKIDNLELNAVQSNLEKKT